MSRLWMSRRRYAVPDTTDNDGLSLFGTRDGTSTVQVESGWTMVRSSDTFISVVPVDPTETLLHYPPFSTLSYKVRLGLGRPL